MVDKLLMHTAVQTSVRLPIAVLLGVHLEVELLGHMVILFELLVFNLGPSTGEAPLDVLTTEGGGIRSSTWWVPTLALPLPSGVTLGRSRTLSVLQFPLL